MSLVDFVHRGSKPTSPNRGTFYWVEGDETKIYFASSDDEDGLILLNDKLDEDTINKITKAENDIIDIQQTLITIKDEILNDIDLSPYLTDSDLDDYAKKSEIPDVSNFATKGEIPDVSDFITKDEIPEIIMDSDYDIIIEKVNEKLTWKVI